MLPRHNASLLGSRPVHGQRQRLRRSAPAAPQPLAHPCAPLLQKPAAKKSTKEEGESKAKKPTAKKSTTKPAAKKPKAAAGEKKAAAKPKAKATPKVRTLGGAHPSWVQQLDVGC